MIPEWHFEDENKDAKKLSEMISAEARRLEKAIHIAESDDEKYSAVHSFYRKYYTLTLSKSHLQAGINKSPTRDIILDFPWKELNLNRIQCLKIWEKINH
ncbi:MAG: hypothetical protein AB7I27_11330 [Bacteriovoracaceae bacterium]